MVPGIKHARGSKGLAMRLLGRSTVWLGSDADPWTGAVVRPHVQRQRSEIQTWRCAQCRQWTQPSKSRVTDQCNHCGTGRVSPE